MYHRWRYTRRITTYHCSLVFLDRVFTLYINLTLVLRLHFLSLKLGPTVNFGRASDILFLGITTKMFICEWVSMWLRWWLNAWDDFNEILHLGFSTQTLGRVRWWARSLQPFQNSGHFNYLKNNKSWTAFSR